MCWSCTEDRFIQANQAFKFTAAFLKQIVADILFEDENVRGAGLNWAPVCAEPVSAYWNWDCKEAAQGKNKKYYFFSFSYT